MVTTLRRDFQGWPETALTLREILELLGFNEDDNTIYLVKDKDGKELLDSYPRIFEDDGMAYGVNPSYVIALDTTVYKNEITEELVDEVDSNFVIKKQKKNIDVFNIFIDCEPKNEEEAEY